MLTKSKSIDYWENLVNNNKTLKGKIFEMEPITERTMYIHYVIFNKKTGIENVWAPIPDINKVLGFIQFCFLPEAYYKWIEGQTKVVTQMPTLSIEKILKDAIRHKKLTDEEEKHMKEEINSIKKIWQTSGEKTIRDLRRFCYNFNSHWLGDSTKFLYIKVFKNAKELGEFVLDSNILTDYEEVFENKIKMSRDQWISLCENVCVNKEDEDKFKNILFKQLTEVI